MYKIREERGEERRAAPHREQKAESKLTPSEREINKNNAVVNSFSATAHAFTRHDGHSNLTSYSPRSSPDRGHEAWGHCATQFQCARPRISVVSDAFACQKRISYIAMRVWVSTRRRLSRLSVNSLCLLGRLSVCRGRVASETYAKLLTQKATKRNANTARTARKARSEEKQRKSCRLRLCCCLCRRLRWRWLRCWRSSMKRDKVLASNISAYKLVAHFFSLDSSSWPVRVLSHLSCPLSGFFLNYTMSQRCVLIA